MTDQENDDITNILRSYDYDIGAYISGANEFKPSIGKTLTFDNQYKSILSEADDEYAKLVAVQMKLAKLKVKQLASTQQNSFSTDKINQELANVPLKIEEKVDEVKKTIDTLLGKVLAPVFQPDLPDFDVDKLIELIKTFLNPVISATNPLKAVVGKIPVLGELAGVMGMMQDRSGQQMSKEELKKVLPKKPEPD